MSSELPGEGSHTSGLWEGYQSILRPGHLSWTLGAALYVSLSVVLVS